MARRHRGHVELCERGKLIPASLSPQLNRVTSGAGLFEPLIRETQAKKIAHRVEPSLLRPKSADGKPRHSPSVRCAASRRCNTYAQLVSCCICTAPRSYPIGMLVANPADAETNGTVLIHGSWGCFCRKLTATLSPLDDRILGPCPGAHRPAAKAHTRGGQYQFERACPLAAFSEIAQDPIRELGKRKDVTVEARPLTTAKRAKSSFRRLLQRKYPHPSRILL